MDNNLLVDELLEEINKNPYKYLKEKGYKGRPREILSCPIAKCFKAELGKPVYVGGEFITIVVNGEKRQTIKFDLPENIQKFIYDFDNGEYVDLAPEDYYYV